MMFSLEVSLDSPWMNAAGTLGFAPSALSMSRWQVPAPMGAFVTNPISLHARTPAADRGLMAFPGGVLLHSGLINPGLRRVIRKYSERWAQSSVPVWVHLIGQQPDEIHQMVRQLEGLDGVAALEIGIPPEASGSHALAFIEAAFGELPIAAHIPLTSAGEGWVEKLREAGASAISLGGPRGALPSDTGRPVNGRLYGPGLFPLMMAAVQNARRLGIPVIAGAGVYRGREAQALRDAGAWAVQLDTVLWRGWKD